MWLIERIEVLFQKHDFENSIDQETYTYDDKFNAVYDITSGVKLFLFLNARVWYIVPCLVRVEYYNAYQIGKRETI